MADTVIPFFASKFLSSCSIKENRACPCWMTVEMPDRVGQDGRYPVGAGEDGERVVVDRLPRIMCNVIDCRNNLYLCS